ncbi:MAG: rhomboid family intramembrane serine protease [Bacteroidales bacterium]|nr:MAG: rhomboid family intramembrane serine protease [Bacteroidales bacterium]
MTIIIIIVTVGISMLAFSNREIMDKLQFTPYRTIHNKEWHRLFTHGFVHADYMHLFINMFVLYSFGAAVESIFKSLQYSGIIQSWVLHFSVLYFGGIVIASLTTLKKHKDNFYYHSVGASGAVSAIVFTFIFFDPLQKLLFMFIIPIPAIVFGVLYLAYTHYMSKKGGDNINHDAHFIGSVFGFVYPLLINPKLFFVFLERLGIIN